MSDYTLGTSLLEAYKREIENRITAEHWRNHEAKLLDEARSEIRQLKRELDKRINEIAEIVYRQERQNNKSVIITFDGTLFKAVPLGKEADAIHSPTLAGVVRKLANYNPHVQEQMKHAWND